MKSRKKQEGVALAISLVLLVAVTILGITTLSGTRLNEKITSNAQNKSIAFEVAESGISSVWSKTYLMTAITDASVAANDPTPLLSPKTDTGVDTDFNQGTTVALDGSLTVQYCGEGIPVGTSLNSDKSNPGSVYLLIDINSVATINNASTQADHLQRAAIVAPKTGRTGACVTR